MRSSTNSTQVSRLLRSAGHMPATRVPGQGTAVTGAGGYLVYQDVGSVIVEYHWGGTRHTPVQHRAALNALATTLQAAGYISERTPQGTLLVHRR